MTVRIFGKENQGLNISRLPLYIQIVAQMFYVEWMNEAFENYGFILIKTLVVRSLNVVFTFLLIRRPEDTLLYALLSSLTIFANYLISFVYAKKRIPLYRISKDDLKVLVKPLFIMTSPVFSLPL